MASASVDLADEIERLSTEIEALETELTPRVPHTLRAMPAHDPFLFEDPPALHPFSQQRHEEPQAQPRPRVGRQDATPATAPRRKEIEARRYNGKEPVAEYLLQFDLTARRNGWSNREKVTSLLCALDGPARSLLAEIDDVDTISYSAVKELLTKRFGPISLPDVHEQALQDLRLARGQPIREVTAEVSRLVKLAYPEFDAAARERFAIKALINATADKDTIFYIKEKNPSSMEEVCTLYERYRVLTGHAPASRPANVKATRPDDKGLPPPDHPAMSALLKQTEAQQKQLADLSAAVTRLLQQQQQQAQAAPAQPRYAATAPPFALPQAAPRQATPLLGQQLPQNNASSQGRVPVKPCPRCHQSGHWAKDCPQAPLPGATPPPDACYRCGMPGHFSRDCPTHLNGNGSAAAPTARPRPPYHQ